MKFLKKRGVRTEAALTKVRQEASYLTVDYYHELGYPVGRVCEELGIARSAYYKNKNRVKPEKEKQDELLCSLISEYHTTFDGILGYRRMN